MTTTAFDPIDNWFEKGFRVRAQRGAKPKREASRSRAGAGLSSKSGVKTSSSARVKNAVSVVRKAPEVMVKITGSSSGTASVKRHLEYISRNGEVEMTDETGSSIHGRQQVKDLSANYKAAQIPEESKRREFLHVIFSMPAGTPAAQMRESVMQFCKEEFANRRYVAAYHDDTDHAHMHVCINTRDIDRADEPRLSPRKEDLFRWRQGFADKLRENGIDAAASGRQHRFNYRKPEHSVVRHIRAENPQSAVFDENRHREKAAHKRVRDTMLGDKAFVGPPKAPRTAKVVQGQAETLKKALESKERPRNPAKEAIDKSSSNGIRAWTEVKKNLLNEGQHELAKGVQDLIDKGKKPVNSRAQELFDSATAMKKKPLTRDGHGI